MIFALHSKGKKEHDDYEACLNLVIYLIKDAIYQVNHGETESDVFEAVSWLMTVEHEIGGFDWYCSLARLNPEWTRKQVFKDLQTLKSPKFRSPVYLINSQVL